MYYCNSQHAKPPIWTTQRRHCDQHQWIWLTHAPLLQTQLALCSILQHFDKVRGTTYGYIIIDDQYSLHMMQNRISMLAVLLEKCENLNIENIWAKYQIIIILIERSYAMIKYCSINYNLNTNRYYIDSWSQCWYFANKTRYSSAVFNHTVQWLCSKLWPRWANVRFKLFNIKEIILEDSPNNFVETKKMITLQSLSL